jgi:hypothetical protein
MKNSSKEDEPMKSSGPDSGNVLVTGMTSCCAIPAEWLALPLLRIEPHNHDTAIFSFGLPEGKQFLNLSTCGCLLLLAPNCEHGGGDAVRPYTPISSSDTEGHFDLLIKRYDQWGDKCEPNSIFSFFSYNASPHAYRPKGAVSNYLFESKVGDLIQVCLLSTPRP